MRINIGPDEVFSHFQSVIDWLKESGIKVENVPLADAYIVKGEGEDWWLVARRFVRDTKGEKMHNVFGRASVTIPHTVRVGRPPDCLLPERLREAGAPA